MKNVLLCSHNPILLKSLYGLLRDEGYVVEVTDHSADAVRLVMDNSFHTIIIDVKSFGLSAEDAVPIIKTLSPDVRVILIGYPELKTDELSIKVPEDLAALKELLHDFHHNINTVAQN